ncbi:MAG: YceD family protein [Pseudomonadales bacterium]
MQSQRDLPGEVSIARLLAAEAQLEGRLAIRQLKRLLDLLASDEGDANVDLQFIRDDEGRRLIKGSVSASMDVYCQRCLDPMTLTLKQGIALALVAGEDTAKQLPEELEPLIVVDDTVDLHALVEDELLLALPIVSLHEQSCATQRYMSAEEPEQEPRQKPFEDLAEMLGKH